MENINVKKSIFGTLLISVTLISGCSTMAPGTKVKEVVERNGVNLEFIQHHIEKYILVHPHQMNDTAGRQILILPCSKATN
jgi:PBP1b-binding outer membrane lipoprotein LpoB